MNKIMPKTMGEQIKLAGISRSSLWKVEKGDPSVAMGIYAAVLHAFNECY